PWTPLASRPRDQPHFNMKTQRRKFFDAVMAAGAPTQTLAPPGTRIAVKPGRCRGWTGGRHARRPRDRGAGGQGRSPAPAPGRPRDDPGTTQGRPRDDPGRDGAGGRPRGRQSIDEVASPCLVHENSRYAGKEEARPV